MGLREYAFEIIEEVKKAANPKKSIKKSIKFDRDKQEIYVKDKVFKVQGKIYLLSVGKAVNILI